MTSVEADCADPIAVVRRIQVSALELPASSFQPPASSFIRTPGFLFALVAGSWKLHGTQISGRNIAEGRGRGSDADFRRFLWYSNGSCNEFETEMLIAHDANFLPSDLHARYADDVCEVRRMLTSLIQTVG
jgi:hypothetical protein